MNGSDKAVPQRIGVLGGGQLARMMALAGLPLGFSFNFLDPAGDACAGVAGALTQADFDDLTAMQGFARHIDVATFDFENVPASSALELAGQLPFYPPVKALESCQDRLVEKQLMRQLDIAVPPFHAVNSRTDLLAAVEELGLPCVLKTRRLGYDGKGQAILRQPEDLERAWQRLGDAALIVEAFVPFEAECSLLAVRGQDGETRYWPLVRNLHHDGVLMLSRPGTFAPALQASAEQLAQRLLQHFDYVGVMTIEFFLREGQLSVNEIAPRVHNSGHWTLDGAETSQFENHLRAISGLPLGSTAMSRPSLMFNWLGELPDRDRVLAMPGVRWHEYGKSPRPGRKLGHATVVAADAAELEQRAGGLARLLGGSWDGWLSRL